MLGIGLLVASMVSNSGFGYYSLPSFLTMLRASGSVYSARLIHYSWFLSAILNTVNFNIHFCDGEQKTILSKLVLIIIMGFPRILIFL